MEELVPQTNIQNYAVRNTSPKMPIERKYVTAFICSIFNSTGIKAVYEALRNELWNEDVPLVFLSYWNNIGELNEEPYRSIIAYSMIKKDEKLFEMISEAFFTGWTNIIYDQDFAQGLLEYTDEDDPNAYYNLYQTKSPLPEYTDEEWRELKRTNYDYWLSLWFDPTSQYEHNHAYNLMHFTDSETHTDMIGGIPYIVFYNIFCNDPIPEEAKSLKARYQTWDELSENEKKFNLMITICKPARAEVLMIYEPYCFISGSATQTYTMGIEPDSPDTPFTSPFGDSTTYNRLLQLSDNDLKNVYKSITAVDVSTGVQKGSDELVIINQDINKAIRGPGYLLMTFELMCKATEFIWGNIILISSDNTLPNIRFSPKDVKMQVTTQHYFIKIQVEFPRNS